MRAPARLTRAVFASAAAALASLLACLDEPAAPAPAAAPPATPSAAVIAPPAASVTVRVQVPAGMQAAPFNVPRYLSVPPNFSAAVHARVPGARYIVSAPNGELLVSNPGAGKISRVVPGAGGAGATVADWLTGLRNPHDMVVHAVAGVTYVYVGESHQVSRYVYNADGSAGARQLLVTGLPDASSPELNGAYGHQLKNIAVGADHALYVSLASATNADPSDVTATPMRGAIYRYDANGANGRLFARGLRNADGLAFVPGTGALWTTVNNRDDIAYPFHQDFNGDGSDDFGKVMAAYVDNHPPEEFTRVDDGANYGWPYCNPNPDTPAGLVDMPFDRDAQTNASGSKLDCGTATRIMRGIQAHSSPLGLLFFQGTAAPAAYREGAAVAYHGSWNRTVPTGYRVAYFPWDAATGRPGAEQDLARGWLDGGVWGRPVDVAVDAAGAILVSDDLSGTIYKLAYGAAATAPAAPTGLAATAAGSAQINLAWADNAADETAYLVERCAGSGCTAFAQVASLAAGTTSYANGGLAANTSYAYRVRAQNGAGVSAYSNTAAATTSAAPAGAAVTSFTLINTVTDQPVAAHDPLVNGAVINFATIGTSSLSVRANTSPAAVGSVVFGYDANASYRVENNAPYAIAGDAVTGGVVDYVPWTPTAGAHTITATPYAGSSGSGTAGTALSVAVTVTTGATTAPPAAPSSLVAAAAGSGQINLTWADNATNETAVRVERCAGATCTAFASVAVLGANATAYANSGLAANTTYRYRVRAENGSGASPYSNLAGATTAAAAGGPTVVSFTLINTLTDQPVPAHDPLVSGAVISFAAVGTSSLSVRANTSPAVVGSVLFGYDASANYRLENNAPYAIAGDAIVGGVPDYVPWTPTTGSHTLSATPYVGGNATGIAGPKLTITFTVAP